MNIGEGNIRRRRDRVRRGDGAAELSGVPAESRAAGSACEIESRAPGARVQRPCSRLDDATAQRRIHPLCVVGGGGQRLRRRGARPGLASPQPPPPPIAGRRGPSGRRAKKKNPPMTPAPRRVTITPITATPPRRSAAEKRRTKTARPY